MGYDSRSSEIPGGAQRDETDQARLRHGRDRHVGFPVGRYLQPPPMLFTRDGHNVFLGDMYRGASAFLICAGPSLNRHDLSILGQRGLLTCAVNNAATVVRPNLWVSVDDPGNFCDAIWRDPAIWKFVPLDHLEKPLAVRDAAGNLTVSSDLVGDMPAVFGYRRNEAFVAEQWLYEDTFNWGNQGDRIDAHGIKGSRSVMLVALRMLFYLGVRRVYLLGCDFRMEYGRRNYAFEQERSRASVSGNNSSYQALNTRFMHLKPHFDAEGFEVFNCTPDSGLTAFPPCDFETAVAASLADFPQTVNTAGMYDRAAKLSGAPVEAPADKSPLELEDGLPIDPVAKLGLPPVTLVTAVDRSNVETFRWTWQTWTRNRGWLRSMPVIVIHEPDSQLAAELKTIVREHAQARLFAVAPDRGSELRDRWSHAHLQIAAREIETDWYLRLDPEAVAVQPMRWLLPEWFSPQEDGRLLAFVSHAWGYTKPADAFARLDEWGETIPSLGASPPLRLPFENGDPHLRHQAVSSWIFLGNAQWTRQILELAPERLPCRSHETFVTYCALRRRDPFVRAQMKTFGWEHSFSRRWPVVERCRAALQLVPAGIPGPAADPGD